jgi:hypothetical protein
MKVMDECLSIGKQGRWTDWFDSTPSDSNVYNGVVYRESEVETR